MRLNQYLIEKDEEAIEQLAEKIKKDCRPYLNIVKRLNHPFMKAMRPKKFVHGQINFGEKTVRQNRKSRLFPDKLSKKLNDYIESKGGARRDRSVISISKLTAVHKTFGLPFWIFPVGKLKYSFLMSDDFNISADLWDPYDMILWLRKDDDQHTPQHIKNFNPDVFFYHNTHIEKAFQNGWEIWFESKKYYYCEPYVKLTKLLGMYWDTTE